MRDWIRVPGDWRRPHMRRVYRAWWCDGCRFGRLWPLPAADDLAGAYDVPEYFTHRAYSKGRSHEPVSTPLRAVQHAAWRIDHGEDGLPEELDGRSLDIVDLGCGNGEHLEALRARGHRGVGIDPDDEAIAVAKVKGLEVYKGVAEELPAAIRGRKFGAVLMIHTLEHCQGFRRALRSAVSLLTPGGWLVVETPNNDAIGLRRSGAGWLWLDPPRHVNFFTEHSLSLACTRAGLSVTRVAYAGYFRQFTRHWMESERAIRDRLGLARPWTGFGLLNAVSLLAGTALAPPRRRYDSVRIIARVPVEGRSRERSIASRRGAGRSEIPGRQASGTWRDARPPTESLETGRGSLLPSPASVPPSE